MFAIGMMSVNESPVHIFMLILTWGRAFMNFTSVLQSITEEKTLSYLGILEIPFLQGRLEWKYQAIQVHLCHLSVQVLLSILGALFHFDLYRKTIMYIMSRVSTNTDLQDRNASCRCSSLQGLPSTVFFWISLGSWIQFCWVQPLVISFEESYLCFKAVLQGLFYTVSLLPIIWNVNWLQGPKFTFLSVQICNFLIDGEHSVF